MKTRILVVAPYPIKNPMHGGQKRTQALVKRYRELSYDVTFAAVYLKASYKEASASDIAVSSDTIQHHLSEHPELTDIITGSALTSDNKTKTIFTSLLKRARPQVIHVEQPYMVDSVRTVINEIGLKSIIIFGSQNVESEMKRGIYKKVLTKSALEKLVKRTSDIEHEAVEIADIVLAVSLYDLDVLTKNTRFKPKFVVRNGIEQPSAHIAKMNEWAVLKKDEQIKHLATFIGSAHPPNYDGFNKLIANAEIAADTRIVVGGGVGSLIKSHYTAHDQLWNKIIAPGTLSKVSLRSLIHESDVILLPILSGGGSNLKTAEAIISGKKIVTTEYAFRGYEQYLSLPNIYVANSPKAFETALKAAINANYVRLSTKQNKLVQAVTWPYALKNMKYVLTCTYILRLIRKLRL